MTPLGHASAAVIAGTKLHRKYFIAFLRGSLIPGTDFLLILFRGFNNMHRTLTLNSFFLAVVTGLYL
jgi:hypothetical protein